MSLISIIGALLLLNGLGFIILANLFLFALVGEVNGKRPEDQHIPLFASKFSELFAGYKMFGIFEEHRRLYPGSKRSNQVLLAFLVGAISGATGFVLLVFLA
jgi:hypothetical protein